MMSIRPGLNLQHQCSQAVLALTCYRLTGSRCMLSTSRLYYQHSQQQTSTRSREQAKPFKSIPGPKPLPLIGNLLDFSRARRSGKRLSDFYDEGLKKYGKIMKLSVPGSGAIVVVADPESLEEVLRAEGKYPQRDTLFSPKAVWFANEFGVPAGLFEDGESWRRQRTCTAINKQILPKVVGSYVEGLNPIYRRFSEHLKRIRDENGLIMDFVPLSKKLTMEATGKFVFGADLDLVVNPKKEDLEFLDKVEQYFDVLGRLTYEPPLFKLYKNKLYKLYYSALMGTNERGYKYAADLEEKLAKGEKTAQSMLKQWLTEKKLTKPEVLGISASMLTGGVHTTAYQSTFLLFELAHHPEAQETLYKEIQSVVGDGPPTAEHLEAMPYLKACIKESFRVRSVGSGSMRVLKKDAVLHGYHVPAGVMLMYWSYTSSKNEKIFEEPSLFKPERWLRKEGSQYHPFSLLPFGFGPRQCYGKRFAELEMKLLSIEMIRQFSLKTNKNDLELVERLVNIVDESVPLYFMDRN